MAQAYLSVPLHEESKPLTAFPALGGLYEFQSTPFGLLTSGASYNRVAQQIKEAVNEATYRVYVDDSLAATLDDFEVHLKMLEKVLLAHEQAGVLLSPSKTKLFLSLIHI